MPFSKSPVLHKRVVTETRVNPKGKAPYTRTNYNNVLCKPWSQMGDNDLATSKEEDVNCPDCLLIMLEREGG